MPKVIELRKFVCVNFEDSNNNKYWQVTLHENDDVHTEWGRVGRKQGEKTYPSAGRYKMEQLIKKKANPNNKPDKLYTEVKVAEGVSSDDQNTVASQGSLKSIVQEQIKIKDPVLKELVDFLVQVNIHNIVEASGGSITYDTSSAQFKTPLGVVLPDQVAIARDLLDDMSEFVVDNDYESAKFRKLLNEYLRLVPHDVGMKKISPRVILPNSAALQKENGLLDGLTASFNDIQSGLTASRGTKKDEPEVPKLFDVTLDLVKDKGVIKHITDYFNNTKLDMHVTSNYRVKRVYEVAISAMNNAFDNKGKPLGNIMELWHGTKCSNLLSILKIGLIIPPSSSGHVTGRLFGNGLYFSDQSTKALNYATNFWGSGGRTDRIFMFLADVAMGKYHVPDSYGWSTNYPKRGTHSTFAKANKSSVRNNEMIVYDTAQANLKYLIEFQ